MMLPTFPLGGEKMMGHDDMSGGEGAAMKVVKLGDQSFHTLADDPNALNSFNGLKAKLIKSDGNIQIPNPDGTISIAPANSVAGKIELLKTQLQIEHGFDADVASKAAKDIILGVKTKGASKMMDGSDSPPAPAKKKPFYSPRGAVKGN